MAAPSISPEALETELERLASLSLGELKARWLELKGEPLPKFMRHELMRRAVAHAVQENTLGGLDPITQKRLDAHVRQIVPSGEAPPPSRRKVKTGTRLIREWQGRTHEVTVVPDGFIWNGERHRSLSQIARLITGTRWNGWVFFGLKKTGAEPQAASRPQRRRGASPRPSVEHSTVSCEVAHA
jgi:hypothetical protein